MHDCCDKRFEVWKSDGFFKNVKRANTKKKGNKEPVQLVEVEDGEEDAEKVDQDPDGIQHIVTIWSLGSKIMTIIKDQYQGPGLRI